MNILKINHFLFNWYYKKCGDHFKQWTFFKSVKLLIQNYEHQTLLYNNGQEHIAALIVDNNKMRKELFDIKMNQIASDDQIDILKFSIGMKIHTPSEN